MAEPLQVLLLILGIVVLLGLVFVLIGTIRHRMTRDWVETTGQVINRRGDPLGGMPARYPTFRWQDSTGAEHRHTSMMGASLGPAPGKLVQVKYDPANPARGMINTPVQNGRLFTQIGAAMIIAAVLAGGFGWWAFSQIVWTTS